MNSFVLINFLFLVIFTLFTISCTSESEATVKSAMDGKTKKFIRYGQVPTKWDPLKTSNSIVKSNMPWSGSYWPYYAGGVSRRWQMADETTVENLKKVVAKNPDMGLEKVLLEYTESDYYEKTDYTDETTVLEPLKAENIKKLPIEVINALSPLEKYEIWTENYDFTLTRFEQSNIYQSDDRNLPTETPRESWEGICHAWSLDSQLHEKPGDYADVDWNGQKIRFYHSDIKGLITRYYDYETEGDIYAGDPCSDFVPKKDKNGRPKNPACQGVNPGAFHMVLEDFLTKGKLLVADVTNNSQIWNHPIISFNWTSSNIRALTKEDPHYEHRATGTVTLVDVVATY